MSILSDWLYARRIGNPRVGRLNSPGQAHWMKSVTECLSDFCIDAIDPPEVKVSSVAGGSLLPQRSPIL